MREKHIRRLAVLLLIATVAPAFAQDVEEDGLFVPTHELGDQTLGINLGLFVPLFFTGGDAAAPANLTLGAVGSLAWGSYITNEFKLGLEAGGSFALTPNRRTLFLLPIVVNASYIFQAYPFEFPVTMGLGMSFARLEEYWKLDPFVKAGGSFFWNYSSQWAFGANLHYWVIPQIYTAGSVAGADESRVGNFLEFTLSALYHF